MSITAPRSHRQFARIEARYRGAVSPGWYLADLGDMAPFVTVPTWVYATWSPFEVNLIGSVSSEYIALVDNTYVSSFAINMAKIELAAQMFPGAHDYASIMIGNMKKYFAEQRYIIDRSQISMQWVVEYLIEFNGKNRAIEHLIRDNSQAAGLLQLIAECAAFLLLMHEVGHVAYTVGDYRLRERKIIQRHIADVAGNNHSIRRLNEEVFCDVFALINVIGLFNREKGWDPIGLMNICLHVLSGALLCIKTRDVAKLSVEGGPKISLDPTQDILAARAEVAYRVMHEVMDGDDDWLCPVRTPIPFSGNTLNLQQRWVDTLVLGVLDGETRNIVAIIAAAFADPTLNGFDFVMGSLNQIRPLSGSPGEAPRGDIRRWDSLGMLS